jgi:ASC-1-like (ASCH) protein
MRQVKTVHPMGLRTSHFNQIKTGVKIIESRLLDEKRQRIQIGDEILFSLANDSSQQIRTEVIGLSKHATFSDLFDALPNAHFGSTDKKYLMGIYEYYSKEDEARYGVVGIIVKIISND